MGRPIAAGARPWSWRHDPAGFCFAHARGKFSEVYKAMQPPFTDEVIGRLQAVYPIEAEIRGMSAGATDLDV